MADDETPSRYPYLVSVRGGRPVPARRDGSFYVCAYETFLGRWWSKREVQVLEHDPHRDFLREQRQAYLAAHPEAAHDLATPTPTATDTRADQPPPPSDAATPLADAPTLWEQVASRPVARPAPEPAAPPASAPRLGW